MIKNNLTVLRTLESFATNIQTAWTNSFIRKIEKTLANDQKKTAKAEHRISEIVRFWYDNKVNEEIKKEKLTMRRLKIQNWEEVLKNIFIAFTYKGTAHFAKKIHFATAFQLSEKLRNGKENFHFHFGGF